MAFVVDHWLLLELWAAYTDHLIDMPQLEGDAAAVILAPLVTGRCVALNRSPPALIPDLLDQESAVLGFLRPRKVQDRNISDLRFAGLHRLSAFFIVPV